MRTPGYELVVFDMDGTILDTLEDLADSVNRVLERFQYPARTLEEVRRFVGNGRRKLLERALPAEVSEEEAERIFQEFTSYYQAHCAQKTRPYQGIPRLLETLRASGCRTAVVSNKADPAVRELCARFFPGLFDAMSGERDGVGRKPAPDMVDAILGELSVPRERAVYVGDSEVDIATARNAGLACVSVSWGFREKEFLRAQGAERIADTPGELEALLCGPSGGSVECGGM